MGHDFVSELMTAYARRLALAQQVQNWFANELDRSPPGSRLAEAGAFDAARKALADGFPADPMQVRISILGTFRSGKSTLVNALLGAELLPAALAPTTATVTHIVHRTGDYRAVIRYKAADDAQLRAGQALLEQSLTSFKGTTAEAWRSSLASSSEDSGSEASMSLDDLEFVLGAYGALTAGCALDASRFEDVVLTPWLKRRALPQLPHQAVLGTTHELTASSVADLEHELRPFVSFTDAFDGEAYDPSEASRLFLIDQVLVQGPFGILGQAEDGGFRLSLVDTPGLNDPRQFVGGIVRRHLDEADCVALNLAAGVISETDADVFAQLFVNSLRVHRVIVIIGKKDTLETTSFDNHIRKQRDTLAAILIRKGVPERDAKDIAGRAPFVPVCALASLERQRAAHGSPARSPMARARAEAYPTDEHDGTALLRQRVRECLDGSTRLQHLKTGAERSLDRAVDDVRAALAAGIQDRRRSIEELEGQLRVVTDHLGNVISRSEEELLAARGMAEQQWQDKQQALLDRFELGLATVALTTLPAVSMYVDGLAAGYWRHYSRLKAVIRRGGTFYAGDYDSVFLAHLEAAVIGGFIGAVKRLIVDHATMTRQMLADTEVQIRRALDDLQAALDEEGSEHDEVAMRRALAGSVGDHVSRCRAELDQELDRLQEAVFEDVRADLHVLAEELVVRWCEDCEGMSGRGVAAAIRERLRHRLNELLRDFPSRVATRLRPHLELMSDRSLAIALKLFDSFAAETRQFIGGHADRLREAIERRRSEDGAVLEEEAKGLDLLAASFDQVIAAGGYPFDDEAF